MTEEPKKLWEKYRWLLLFFLFFFATIFILPQFSFESRYKGLQPSNSGGGNSDSGGGPEENMNKGEEKEVHKGLDAVFLGWRKDNEKNLMLASFRFTNNTEQRIDTITVRCSHYNDGKESVGNGERALDVRLRPGQTKSVRYFDMGSIDPSAASAACSVTKVE